MESRARADIDPVMRRSKAPSRPDHSRTFSNDSAGVGTVDSAHGVSWRDMFVWCLLGSASWALVIWAGIALANALGLWS